MTAGCPSDERLELHLARPERSAVAAHVAGCSACEERIAELRRQNTEFRARLYPRTIDAVLDRYDRQSTGLSWRWLFGVGAVAVPAMALLVFVRPAAHPDDGLQTKGLARVSAPIAQQALPFTVYVDDRRGVRAAADGTQVAPDAQLRFTVNPPERCWFSVVSVDGHGAVTRLYPSALSGIEVPQPMLPGGAVLDGESGPERLFALCSRSPLPVQDVERAAKAAGDARHATHLPLPADVLQGTVLLDKH